MQSNFLVKAFAVAVIFIFIFVAYSKLKSSDEEQKIDSETLVEEPTAGLTQLPEPEPYFSNEEIIIDDRSLQETFNVELDTDKTVMNELLTEFKAIRTENQTLREQNRELSRNIGQLLRMEDSIVNRVDNQLDRVQKNAERNNKTLEKSLNESNNILDGLRLAYDDLSLTKTKPGAKSASEYEINGFNSESLGFDESGNLIDDEELVWQMPMDVKTAEDGKLTLPKINMNGVNFAKPVDQLTNRISGRRDEELTKEERSIKAYTIPQNATLFGSVGMTALLGRVPTSGVVQQPYPFKIIIGQDNLSSNGIKIPNLTGIKMSGIAAGDWLLSCVSGEIRSMTFTFRDGTIVTYPEPVVGEASQQQESIGWFSDEAGVPCITGKRLTNAKEYLSQRIGLGAIGAYADAKVAEQFTNVVNTNGGSSSSLTGDPLSAARNNAISGGVREVDQWLRERQDRAFDAVYVQPGTSMIVHITRQIPIDYDPEGRRVSHSENFNTIPVRSLSW